MLLELLTANRYRYFKYGLPKVIRGHQSYWPWGARNYSGQTVIGAGETPESAGEWFEEIAVVAELHNP